MTAIIRKPLILGFCVLLSGIGLMGQIDETEKILTQTGSGIIQLIALDKNKQEIAKGTAFAISPGIAVTSYHLVSLAAGGTGINIKKKSVDIGGIIAVDKTLDLALVKIGGKVTPLALGSFAGVAAGQKIYAVGANESGDIAVAAGEIRALHETAPNQKVAETTLAVPDTFSGGVVVGGDGQIIGVIQAPDRRLRFIAPANAVAAMPKTGKVTAWKAWQAEDYSGTFESAWLIGRLYSWMDEAFSAQRNLEKVVKAQPDNLAAWDLLAKGFDKQRDYSNAITAFTKVTELDPKRADAYFGLGQIYVRMQRSKEAIAALEKSLELKPENPVAYLQLGTAHENARDFVKAAESYEKYIASNPANVWTAYQRLGACRFNAEQYDQAAAAYGEAHKGQPQDQNIVFNLAQSYQKAGKFDKAEESFKILAQLAPNEAEKPYSYILKMYSDAGQWGRAMDAARKITELRPKDEQALYNLAYMYQQNQKLPEAIELYKKAIALKPNYDYAWFQVGWCHYAMKNYKETIAAMKKNVEIVPDNVYGWLYIGMSYMQLKDFNNALDPMKKAVDVQPDNANALFNLGVIYLNLKDRYSAQEIAKKLQTIDANLAAKLRSYIK